MEAGRWDYENRPPKLSKEEVHKKYNNIPIIKPEMLNQKYDLTFIDGGHDYDVVRNDFEIAKKNASKNSIIIFHDIDASACDGPRKLWKSIIKNKTNNMKTYQYICKDYQIRYGIGIVVLSP